MEAWRDSKINFENRAIKYDLILAKDMALKASCVQQCEKEM